MPADNDTTAAAAAPALTLPPFSATDAAPWFLRVEALFRLRAISSSTRKADYVIGALPTEIFSQVSHWLMTQTDEVRYDDLKSQIIQRCSPTPEERAKSLMSLMKLPLGDQRPSVAFQEMRALTSMTMPDGSTKPLDLLRVLWLLRLPDRLRSAITDFASMSEAELLKKADSLRGASTLATTSSTAAVAEVHQDDPDDEALMMAAQQRPTQRPPRVTSRPSAGGSRQNLCFFHARFGQGARRCRSPCSWSKNA